MEVTGPFINGIGNLVQVMVLLRRDWSTYRDTKGRRQQFKLERKVHCFRAAAKGLLLKNCQLTSENHGTMERMLDELVSNEGRECNTVRGCSGWTSRY